MAQVILTAGAAPSTPSSGHGTFYVKSDGRMYYMDSNGLEVGPVVSQILQNSRSAAYTTTMGDAQGHILHPASDNNARTFTIDSNANVPYPIGTAITFVNKINTVTIAIMSDTLTQAGSGSTGSRTLAANGLATALKITATEWMISGTGLT